MDIEKSKILNKQFNINNLSRSCLDSLTKYIDTDPEKFGYFKFYRPHLQTMPDYTDKIEYNEVTYSTDLSIQFISKQHIFIAHLQDKIRENFEKTQSPVITIGPNKLITVNLLNQMYIVLLDLLMDRLIYVTQIEEKIALIKKMKNKKSIDRQLRLLIEMIDYDNYLNSIINSSAYYLQFNGFFNIS